jgi:PPM family protein phosphatase
MSALGRVAGTTHAGRKRRRNEDAYVVAPPLFAVADGVGGAAAGEIASSLAAAAVQELEGGVDSGERRVAQLIQEANRRVYKRSSEDDAVSGMGTTMTVALLEDDEVAIGHVGDSRAYLIRGADLEQLTEDHSLVAELVRSGKLSPQEAESHPQRSVITRALGSDPDVDIDTFSIHAEPGDLFLLCSDGLTDMIDDDRILAEIERNRDDLKAAAKALVSAANKVGGEDNITVVFFEIAEEGAELEETAAMPAASTDGAADPAHEETLDEHDRVPTVDTMVVPPDEAEELAEDAEEGERPTRWPHLLALSIYFIAMLAVAAIVYWTLR